MNVHVIENVHHHDSLWTLQQLVSFSWEFLPNPPYSPEIVFLDYYFFCHFQNLLQHKCYDMDEDIKKKTYSSSAVKALIFEKVVLRKNRFLFL